MNVNINYFFLKRHARTFPRVSARRISADAQVVIKYFYGYVNILCLITIIARETWNAGIIQVDRNN